MINLKMISPPYETTPELQEMLASMPLEFGTANADLSILPATHAWEILDNGLTVGYAWVSEIPADDEMLPYLNLGVLEGFRGRQYGTRAYRAIEEELAGGDWKRLYCQVNSNKPASGLKVRQFLIKNGFEIIENDYRSMYSDLTDEEFACECAAPLHFFKDL